MDPVFGPFLEFFFEILNHQAVDVGNIICSETRICRSNGLAGFGPQLGIYTEAHGPRSFSVPGGSRAMLPYTANANILVFFLENPKIRPRNSTDAKCFDKKLFFGRTTHSQKKRKQQNYWPKNVQKMRNKIRTTKLFAQKRAKNEEKKA